MPVHAPTRTRWWFETVFIFTPTWGEHPIWLIFSKDVFSRRTRGHIRRGLLCTVLAKSSNVLALPPAPWVAPALDLHGTESRSKSIPTGPRLAISGPYPKEAASPKAPVRPGQLLRPKAEVRRPQPQEAASPKAPVRPGQLLRPKAEVRRPQPQEAASPKAQAAASSSTESSSTSSSSHLRVNLWD